MDQSQPEAMATESPSTQNPESKPARKSNPIRDILETAIIAILIFVLVRSVVLNFKVDGDSMLPSFESGEMILVSRVSYGEFNLGDVVDWIPGVPDQHWFTIIDYGSPERGDVVVFTPPEPGQQKPYIKRVIGLPGDRVQITGDNQVLVNGTALEEEYIGEYESRCTSNPLYCDVTVPPGHVFVMGDHRDRSEDSRFFGVVQEDRIIGKAWLVYWPLDKFSPVNHEEYPELNP